MTSNIFFKKAFILIVMQIMTFSLFSCKNNIRLFTDYDRHMLPLLDEDTEYDIPDNITCSYASGGSYYWYDGKTVFGMDFETGKITEFYKKENATNIAVEQNRIYLADNSTITVKELNGEDDIVIELPEEVSEAYCFDACNGIIICGSGNTVWKYTGGKWSGTEITNADVVKDSRRSDVDLSNSSDAYISSIKIIDDDSAAVILSVNYEYEFGGAAENGILSCVYTFDLDSGMTNFLYRTSQGIDVSEGNIYLINGTGNTVLRIDENGQTSVVRRVSSGDIGTLGGGVVQYFCVSDKSIFIHWRNLNKAVVYSPKTLEKMLNVAVSSNDAEKLIKSFGYEVTFNPIIYDGDKIVTKLSEKLLAGDNDFDIAWVRQENGEIIDLLNAILIYRQYADLNQNSRLASHLDDMYPGALEMLTMDDGTVGIIPTDFLMLVMGKYNGYEDITNEIPSKEWIDEYIFEICDRLIERGDGTALLPKALPARTARILFDIMSGAVKDADDPDAVIEDFLTCVKKYIDAKVFTGTSSHIIDVMNMQTLGILAIKPDHSQMRVIPPVTIGEDGKSPIQITGFFFVNPNSPNIDKALEFLADLTDEDRRYNSEIYQSLLWPDVSDYGTVMLQDHREIAYDENGSEYDKTPMIAAGTKLPAYPEAYNDYFDDLNANIDEIWRRYTIAEIPMSERISAALQDFIAGKATVETTKSELTYAMKYRANG